MVTHRLRNPWRRSGLFRKPTRSPPYPLPPHPCRYRGGGWGRPSGVGVADSFDGGVTWSKYSGNPVWSGGDAHCAGQPWVYKESDQQYWLFASTNHPPRVCVASSTDGTTWVNASDLGSSAVSLPPSGTLFGNRAVWKETGPGGDAWKMLQECGTTRGVWEIFLYEGSSPTSWKVGNGGEPLTQLQRHPGSMYGGCHIATVDGVYMPRDPSSGLYNIWYHAGARGNLPTDIYHATSPDLMNWTVAPAGPVVTHQGGGSFAFDQVADPSPLTVGLRAYLAYDGDNNGCHGCSHAAIGMAVGSAVP